MFSFEGAKIPEELPERARPSDARWRRAKRFRKTFAASRELQLVRVNGDEGTPVPIPNTVVKLINGDNTWLATAREDNTTRTQTKDDPMDRPFSLPEILLGLLDTAIIKSGR